MNNKSSIGLIKPSSVKFDNSLLLECGKELNGFEMVYETYGRLNKNHSNAVDTASLHPKLTFEIFLETS